MSAAAWHRDLESVRSRGAMAPRPGSLAGLHAARELHKGQFFTSPALVAYLWRYVERIDALRLSAQASAGTRSKLAVFDNSCGSGRMFWPADPERHVLYGCDIDGESVDCLAKAVKAAGFEATVLNAGMEEIDAGHADIAIINPPFGLQLQSPFLTPAEGVTTWGRHGPDTAALSQSYAIAQALNTCDIVLAIVPTSFGDTLKAVPRFAGRLRAIVHLPPGLFRDEGTDVRVSLAAFGVYGSRDEVIEVTSSDLTDELPDVRLELGRYSSARRAPKPRSIEDTQPVITTPLTGDRRVRIAHSGRRIVLSFSDGLTQAKVLNALYDYQVAPRQSQRLPKGARYAGQAWLDIENLLGGDQPQHNLTRLLSKVAAAGGIPEPSDSLVNYYRKRLRTDRVRKEPFRRWAHVAGVPDMSEQPVGAEVQASVTTTHLVDPTRWDSAVLQSGEIVTLRVLQDSAGDRAYEVERKGRRLSTLLLGDVRKRFAPQVEARTGWHLIHAGRRQAFPKLAAARARHAEGCGLRSILKWDPASNEDCYQFDDVVELAMASRGCLAWAPGMGKARGGIALCLMGGEHNALIVESHLVPEIVEELEKLQLDPSLWQVIDSPNQLGALRKINILSYARLRSPLYAGAGRRTYARALRRRLHTVAADEAHVVRNRGTAQTQALWMLSPKKRYAMTGTPIANYCRDALPLIIWAGGDGTSYQAYGEYQPFICDRNLQTMQEAERGLDVFKEKFVSVEWAVREFEENLRDGAKREVPRLKNVEAFRELLAPHVLRRVMGEPEVERWIQVPKATPFVHEIEWDRPHLKAYLRTAWEFATWFREVRRKASDDKHINLVSVLAHISETFKATNVPHLLNGPAGAYYPETSKQRFALDLIRKFVSDGRKTILYATNPAVLERLERQLRQEGIEAVLYHGGIPISVRTRNLNRQFRRGPAMVLLIALGCGQTGLNLPQASRMIFYNRSWTPKTEEQAGHRVLRPQQKLDVEAHYLHLRGAIDEYQAMHVLHKGDAIHAGLDYGEQEICEGEFLHLTTIIGQFCEDLITTWGLQHHHDILEALDRAA